jgi:hypothetical protein
MSDELKCTSCAGRLEAGFLPELADGNFPTVPTDWVEGEPKKSFWGGLKLSGTKPIEITTWRCRRCGYLENYAPDEGSAG